MTKFSKKEEEFKHLDNEAAVICTLIEHPEYSLYSDHLSVDFFSDKVNAALYLAIKDLYDENIKNIDFFNIDRILKREDYLQIYKEIDSEIIMEYLEISPAMSRHDPAEYESIIRDLTDLAYRRDLHRNLEIAKSFCSNTNLKRHELQKKVYEKIDEPSGKYTVHDDTPMFSEIADDLWNQTRERQSSGSIGIRSKIDILNKYCTYEEGELIVVCGVRKEGKSMFCMNELADKLSLDIPSLYIDTEMNSRSFQERLLSNLTGVPVRSIKEGSYTPEQEDLISDARKWLKSKNFTHIYMPSWTKEQLYIITKKLKRKNDLQFFIMDYFKGKSASDASSLYIELGDSVNYIKNEICGELGLSGLSAAQLNRGGDIGDSFKIEQYASTVLTLRRKTKQQEDADGSKCGNYKLFVKLNRLGDQMGDIEHDYIDLYFNGSKCLFEQALEQHSVVENPFG